MALDSPDTLAQLKTALARGGPAELRQALSMALARLRPMDPAGAWAVVDSDPGLADILARASDEETAGHLLERLEILAGTKDCLACGTCCRTSSPTLYARDLELVRSGALPRKELFCLRAGERARSDRLGKDLVLKEELIKLRERPDRGCVFLENSRCRLYESRPWQCRWLECWSGRHAGQLGGQPRLGRRELFADDPIAWALIQEYEVKLSAQALDHACRQAAQGGAEDELLRLIQLDARLRQGVGERYGYQGPELELMWGRAAWEIARAYGVSARIDEESAG